MNIEEEKIVLYQQTINLQNYDGNIAQLLEQVAELDEQLNIWTAKGAVVVLSEEILRGILATAEINANPEYKAELLESIREPWEMGTKWEDLKEELKDEL